MDIVLLEFRDPEGELVNHLKNERDRMLHLCVCILAAYIADRTIQREKMSSGQRASSWRRKNGRIQRAVVAPCITSQWEENEQLKS